MEEELRSSDDGLSVGPIYKEDAQFIKDLLKGQIVTNRSKEAIHAGRQQMDAQEALATPRPHARTVDRVFPIHAEERTAASPETQLSSPNRETLSPRVVERPARPWADG